MKAIIRIPVFLCIIYFIPLASSRTLRSADKPVEVEADAVVRLLSRKRSADNFDYEFSVEVSDEIRTYKLRKTRSPFSSDFKVYEATVNDLGESMLTVSNENIDPFPDIFTTDKRDAAVFVNENGDNIEIEGFLEHNLRIVPSNDRYKRSADGFSHKVYRRSNRAGEAYENLISENIDFINSKEKREIPTTYPEIFIVYDFDSTKVYNGDETAIKKYLAIYLSMANRWFELLKQIKINLYGVGLLLIKDFAFQQTCVGGTSQRLDNDKGINSFEKCIYSNIKKTLKTSFDIGVFMTLLTLGHEATNDWSSVVGYGTIAGACFTVDRQGQDFGAALVHDKPKGYDGVATFAHEVSHVMGCGHDGEMSSVSGQPSAAQCANSDGYLMGRYNYNYPLRDFYFSACSEAQLVWFSQTKQAACLKNVPTGTTDIPRVSTLPGSTMTNNEQCKYRYGEGYTFYNPICQSLICLQTNVRYSNGPALDGTPCGFSGEVCYRGNCTFV